MKQNKDVLLVPISDLHTCGTTALFPHYKHLKGGFWQFQHSRYTPSAKQCDMAEHWDTCADTVKKLRKDKRMIIVLDGDMTDGIHHETLQIATRNIGEQAEVNVWLMNRFMQRAGFDKQKGDLIFVVTGTETHTGDVEHLIAEALGAEQAVGSKAHDFLEMVINGKLVWFLHQGAGPGRGPNMGDNLRTWLKNKYWELVEYGFFNPKTPKPLPDLVISGHYHVPVVASYEKEYHKIYGMMLPCFQRKTRFGYKIAAAELERIGINTVTITAGGDIKIGKPIIMTNRDEVVTI